MLRDRIPQLIEVAPEEAISFSCNAVVVGRTVILNDGAPKLAGTLEERGFAVRPLSFTEFIKSGGSAKCSDLPHRWRRSGELETERAGRITLVSREQPMRDLYILRHGIAVEPGTPGIPDDERPLTAKGEKRMRQIARALRRLDLKLDRIVTSPLPRASATADIVAEALDVRDRIETLNLLQAGSSAATVQRWLREQTEDRLMIVGHNPTLSDLVSLLVMGTTQPQICDLKKGGIAALTRTAVAKDLYDIVWIATPRLIRNLAGMETDSSD